MSGLDSVVRVDDAWYVACESRSLRGDPLQTTLYGRPIVLFRDREGAARAFVDRCPHRNVPLSLGRVRHGELECAYHGWRFRGDGACTLIPTLGGEANGPSRCAQTHATREVDGYVWIWGKPNAEPVGHPFPVGAERATGVTVIRRVLDVRGTLYAVAENALDVPHTAFLHGGLFRSPNRGIQITARVNRTGDRVAAEYLGEPRPTGLVARLLAPNGGVVSHFDRFILPSIARVEYALGETTSFIVTTMLVPIEDHVTRQFVDVRLRLRFIPGWLAKIAILPFAMRVFRQDAGVLAAQADSIARFGGEVFASTEVDVLGKHILRLLRHAARGSDAGPAPAQEEEVRLHL